MSQHTEIEQPAAEQTPVPGGTGTFDASQSLASSLVHRFVERPASSTAEAIVRAIDRRREHPDEGQSTEERCAWLRLRAHWQMLALTSREG